MSCGKTKVFIVYYSMYGHIRRLADEIKKGAELVAGVEATLYQVPETLPKEVLEKMHAPPKADHPIITANELKDADGIIFGVPTRFGSAAAQMKAFMDTTGGLWMQGGLNGKPAGVFVSTGSQGGGQETTALTFVTHFAHHGMIFVPAGYGGPVSKADPNEVHGGSPYGAGTFAGDGSRQPTATELAIASYQGESFAKVAVALKAGRQQCEEKK